MMPPAVLMSAPRRRRIPLALLALLGAFSPAGAACRAGTEALERMHVDWLELGGAPVAVKVADDDFERATGMQWLCPEAIRRQPILFVMDEPTPARFHMNNVYVPLDIALLDAQRRVLAVHRMQPGRYLSSDVVIHGALEAYAGAFARWGLKVGAVLTAVQPDLSGRVHEGGGGAE